MKNHLYNDPSHKGKRRALRRNQTEAEKLVWRYLHNKQLQGLRFLRQYSVGPYILDFYCPEKRLAIEIDGGQHAEDKHQVHDQKRSEFLEQNGIKVIRFWNNDVLNNIEGVWEKINDEVLK